MENMTIRPVTLEDFDAVNTLFERMDRVHAEALPDLFQRGEGPARSHEWFAWMSENPDACMLVAEAQGIPVGLVLCTIHSSPALPLFVPRRYGHINELIVRESFQGQGIGQRLIQRIHEWAQEQGVAEIELDVYEFNTKARRLYEYLGYQTMRRTMRLRLL
jgi:ribosomal protein S18 acetylase RimI-like enzyme